MIDSSFLDLLRVLSCHFWSTVQQCGAQLLIHTMNYCDRFVKSARFLAGGVLSATSPVENL